MATNVCLVTNIKMYPLSVPASTFHSTFIVEPHDSINFVASSYLLHASEHKFYIYFVISYAKFGDSCVYNARFSIHACDDDDVTALYSSVLEDYLMGSTV